MITLIKKFKYWNRESDKEEEFLIIRSDPYFHGLKIDTQEDTIRYDRIGWNCPTTEKLTNYDEIIIDGRTLWKKEE